jgi:hypothetical protein
MVRTSNIGIFLVFFIKVFLMYYIFTIEPTIVAKSRTSRTKTAGTALNQTEAAANRLKAARTTQSLDEMNDENERINDEINDDDEQNEISFLGSQYKILISYFIFIVILHFYYV